MLAEMIKGTAGYQLRVLDDDMLLEAVIPRYMVRAAQAFANRYVPGSADLDEGQISDDTADRWCLYTITYLLNRCPRPRNIDRPKRELLVDYLTTERARLISTMILR